MQPGKSYDRLSNETMRRWVAYDMATVRGSVGVDFGAGKLLNRPLFHVQRYIAVDFNEEALAIGRRAYPEAETAVGDVRTFRPGAPIDVALCLLVFENKYFAAEETMSTVAHIVEQIAKDGAFFFNFGPKNLPYESQTDDLLRKAFRTVRKRRYGRLHIPLPFGTATLARLCQPLGQLLVPSDPVRQRIYYACEGRIVGV